MSKNTVSDVTAMLAEIKVAKDALSKVEQLLGKVETVPAATKAARVTGRAATGRRSMWQTRYKVTPEMIKAAKSLDKAGIVRGLKKLAASLVLKPGQTFTLLTTDQVLLLDCAEQVGMSADTISRHTETDVQWVKVILTRKKYNMVPKLA